MIRALIRGLGQCPARSEARSFDQFQANPTDPGQSGRQYGKEPSRRARAP